MQIFHCNVKTGTVFSRIYTFFSLSTADPERMASSMASLAIPGFMGLLALGCATMVGLPCGRSGGGGGGANMGGGGSRVETGEVEVKEGGEEELGRSALLSSSEATFLNFSSSPAASDLVCWGQRSETTLTPEK